MAAIKDNKRNFDEEESNTTSKKMEHNLPSTKGVNGARLPTPQTSPSLSPKQSQVTKEQNQNNSHITTQQPTKTQSPLITTKHSELYHDPELLPLHIVLQQSIDVLKAAQGGPPTISKIQTAFHQNHIKTTLLQDIWTLNPESPVPAQMSLGSSSAALPHESQNLCPQFAPPQSKKKRAPKGKVLKAQILPSAAEKSKDKRSTSESMFPVEWKQRLEYLEARLMKRGYDEENAGRCAIIMRLLCISIGELEGIHFEPEILEEASERLDVDGTQV